MKLYIETKDGGTSEKQFFEYILKELNIEADIQCVNGKDNISNYVPKMQIAHSQNERIIVVFDADKIANGGGFDKRRQELLDFKEKNNIDFDLFLMPNNKDDGDFESILLKSTKNEHKHILSCFDKFQNCVETQNKNYLYYSINDKSKIYSYKELLQGSKDAKYWHFENKNYWDFDNDYVKTLKDFLLEKKQPKP